MCLYPRLIKNRKYTLNKKNKGNIPEIKDRRTEYVAIGCGNCIECRKQKSNNWRIRLYEEIKFAPSAQFVTLTFAEDSLLKLIKKSQIKNITNNDIATLATRLFLERARKSNKKSPKHWLITELGHKGTERIHLHGIIWDTQESIKKNWQYGWIYFGKYVNEQTINYIVKYITKIDLQHPEFTGKILCSPGIGKNYITLQQFERVKFKDQETNEQYIDRKGIRRNLPIYYRNKFYTENQREKLWIQKLDKNERWIRGERINMNDPKGEEKYFKLLEHYRAQNQRLGYGKLKDWSEIIYKRAIKHIANSKNKDKL